MLILPIGQENSEVRRTPWVSYGLMAANVFVFLVLAIGGSERQRSAIHERLTEAWRYAIDHPYLELPETFARRIGPAAADELDELRNAFPDELMPGAYAVQTQQEELDALAAQAEEAVRTLPVMQLGFIPVERRPHTLITALFVHGGWLHLLGNLLFLFLSGPFIEDLYGRTLFTVLYFLSGVMADLAFLWHAPDGTTPLIGASGAIAGIMGAFLVRLGASRIHLLVVPILLIPTFRFKTFVPAYVVLPLWFAEQLWYGTTQGQGTGIAWWAHIGGFVAGVGVALVVQLTGAEKNWIDPGIEKAISLTQNPGLEKAVDARTSGDLAQARRSISAVLVAEPQNVDAWTEAYEIGIASGDADFAGRAAQRRLELDLRNGEREMALQFVTEARERLPHLLPVRFLMSAAGFLEKEGDGRTALDLYQEIAARAPEDPATFRAHFRRAEILRGSGDLRAARAAYEQARSHPACVPPWPQTIEKALAQLGSVA